MEVVGNPSPRKTSCWPWGRCHVRPRCSGFESLHGWSLHKLPGQLVPLFHPPCMEKIFVIPTLNLPHSHFRLLSPAPHHTQAAVTSSLWPEGLQGAPRCLWPHVSQPCSCSCPQCSSPAPEPSEPSGSWCVPVLEAPGWAMSRWGSMSLSRGQWFLLSASWLCPCPWDLGHCCPCIQTNHFFIWTFDSIIDGVKCPNEKVMIAIFFISSKGDPRNKHLMEQIQ